MLEPSPEREVAENVRFVALVNMNSEMAMLIINVVFFTGRWL